VNMESDQCVVEDDAIGLGDSRYSHTRERLRPVLSPAKGVQAPYDSSY
jgi:hypothetical protein